MQQHFSEVNGEKHAFNASLHLSNKKELVMMVASFFVNVEESSMSKRCQVTGRETSVGCTYAIRGIAKKKKGIGLKVTGKTKRRFYPNLLTKRFWFNEENRFVKLLVSIAAMRTIDKNGISSIIRDMRARGEKV